MACSSPESFYIAAEHGLGVLSFNIAKAETLAERIRNYRRMIANPGRQVVAKVNNQIAVFLMTLCGERNDETVEMAGEGMHWYMGVLRGQSPYWMNIFERQRHEVFANVESYKYAAVKAPEALLFGVDADEKTAQEAMKPKNLLKMGLLCAGNPDNCIKVLEGFEALGVDLMLCFMEMGRVPHEATMESIRLFGKYVIPHFNKRATISHGAAAGAHGVKRPRKARYRLDYATDNSCFWPFLVAWDRLSSRSSFFTKIFGSRKRQARKPVPRNQYRLQSGGTVFPGGPRPRYCPPASQEKYRRRSSVQAALAEATSILVSAVGRKSSRRARRIASCISIAAGSGSGNRITRWSPLASNPPRDTIEMIASRPVPCATIGWTRTAPPSMVWANGQRIGGPTFSKPG